MQRYYITIIAGKTKANRLTGEAGFTLIEMVVATLLTAILVVLVAGILWSGVQGFALGGGDYAAAGELVLLGHYLQQDVGTTPPGEVCITQDGNPPCANNGNTLALNNLTTYSIKGTDLWRTVTGGVNLVVVRHLDTGASCGGVCFTLLPQAGEVQAKVDLNVQQYKGMPHKYAGTVTAYNGAVEGLP